MNRIALSVIAAFLLSTPALADHHPNLGAAHNHVKEAIEKLSAAQKANEFDLGGHAAKAKDLLEQAEKEIAQAREATNEKKKK